MSDDFHLGSLGQRRRLPLSGSLDDVGMTGANAAGRQGLVNRRAERRASELGEHEADHAARSDAGKAVAEHPPERRGGFANDVDAVNQYAAPM